MKMSHDFIDFKLKFTVGDRVKIVELNRPGRVLGVYLCDTGLMFQVRYFDNGKAETVYFYPDELTEWT